MKTAAGQYTGLWHHANVDVPEASLRPRCREAARDKAERAEQDANVTGGHFMTFVTAEP